MKPKLHTDGLFFEVIVSLLDHKSVIVACILNIKSKNLIRNCKTELYKWSVAKYLHTVN
jgi:hypothetical protein